MKGIFRLVGVCKHICFTSFWKLWEHDAVSRISFGSSQCFKKQIKMHNYLICIYMVYQYRLFLLNAFHINISYLIMIEDMSQNVSAYKLDQNSQLFYLWYIVPFSYQLGSGRVACFFFGGIRAVGATSSSPNSRGSLLRHCWKKGYKH